MRWTIKRGLASSVPIGQDIVQSHLYLFTQNGQNPDDALVERYIKDAIAWAEGFTRREISQREITLYTDCLKSCYDLPVSPVSEMTAHYLDKDGMWQPLQFAEDLDSDPPYVAITEFPDDWKGGRNSIRFIVDAGYESVPDGMTSGILMLAGHWYANRESVVIGSIAQNVPMTTETILWPFRALDLER